MPTSSRRQTDSLALMRQDLINQAKSISALIDAQGQTNKNVAELLTDREVRKERDILWNQKFTDIGDDIKTIKSALWWVLGTFLAVFIVAAANFVVRGGLDIADNRSKAMIIPNTKLMAEDESHRTLVH